MSDVEASQEQPTVDDPQTLDQVISGFNVQPEQAVEQVQEPMPAQPTHIDPYDEVALNKWAIESLQGEIQGLKDAAKATSDAAEKSATDAKIHSAVKVITKGIEGLDPLAAEFILEKAARDNDKFANLFHNQDKDPDLYKSALDAIIAENDGKFQRVDTQIAENHRAAQLSQQSNNTKTQEPHGNSLEESLANAKNDAERSYLWARIRDGG